MLILQISGSSAICFLIMLAYSIKNDSEESFLSFSSRCAMLILCITTLKVGMNQQVTK